MGIIFGLISLLLILVAIPVFYLVITTESIVLIAVTAVVFVLVLVILGLVNSTLNGIYVAAVYRYAAEGETSTFFAKEMIEGAFRTK